MSDTESDAETVISSEASLVEEEGATANNDGIAGLVASLISSGGVMSGEAPSAGGKDECTMLYAEHMNSMVLNYEAFLNQMKELSLYSTENGNKHSSSSSNGTGKSVSYVNAASNDQNSSVDDKTPSPSSSSSKKEAEVINDDNPVEDSDSPSHSTKFLEAPCGDVALINKKMDAMCVFIRQLFTHQVNLLGKCYQDQMEMYRKMDELKITVDEHEEDFDFLTAEISAVKKHVKTILKYNSKVKDANEKSINNYNSSLKKIQKEISSLGDDIRRLVEISEKQKHVQNNSNSSVEGTSPPKGKTDNEVDADEG